MKVEAIVNLPPLRSIKKLQSLQGKYNFLQHFIVNYANITKGFMCLLKQDTPFVWDETAPLSPATNNVAQYRAVIELL